MRSTSTTYHFKSSTPWNIFVWAGEQKVKGRKATPDIPSWKSDYTSTTAENEGLSGAFTVSQDKERYWKTYLIIFYTSSPCFHVAESLEQRPWLKCKYMMTPATTFKRIGQVAGESCSKSLEFS